MTRPNRPPNGEPREAVRALSRGLAILRYINAAGTPLPGEIAKRLGLPRPTVYRLLQSLEEDGYIACSVSNGRVRVTRIAASLGDGYALTSRVCQAAGPIFGEHAHRIVWPLDISVYDNAAMVIQETTHGRSPLSIDRGMIGYRLPMLRTSAGRAYLAYCPATEREIILDHVRQLGHPEDLPFLEPTAVRTMLGSVLKAGIATRRGEEFRPQTASLAVPVMIGGTVAACVSLIWTRKAMTFETALDRYALPLREIANRISAALDAGGT